MSYDDLVLEDEPLGYWKLGEPSGSPADSSGNGHTGTLTSAYTRSQTGPPGTDWVGMGFSSGYMTAGIAESLNALTLEAWVKTTSNSRLAYLRSGYITDEVETSHYDGFNLSTAVGSSDPVVSFNWASDGFVDVYRAPVDVKDNNWHHVVGTWNGTTFRIFVDGDEQSVTNSQTEATTWAHADPATFISEIIYVGGASNNTLTHVAIYDHALSESRVYAHYAAALGITAGHVVGEALWGPGEVTGDNLETGGEVVAGFAFGPGEVTGDSGEVAGVVYGGPPFGDGYTFNGGEVTGFTPDNRRGVVLGWVEWTLDIIEGRRDPQGEVTGSFSWDADPLNTAPGGPANPGGGTGTGVFGPPVTRTTRWRFTDPSDPSQTYAFRVNPFEMGSLEPKYARTSHAPGGSPEQRIRVTESPVMPFEWSFRGRVYNQDEYDALLTWCGMDKVLLLGDHLGRTWRVLIRQFIPRETPPRRSNADKREYTVQATVLGRVS